MGRRSGGAVAGEIDLVRVEIAGRLARLLRIVSQPSPDDEVAVAVDDLLLDRVNRTDPAQPCGLPDTYRT
jgi:hypothetical protein